MRATLRQARCIGARDSLGHEKGTKRSFVALRHPTATTIVAVSDPGTILVLVLAVPVGLGLLLAVLSVLEDSLYTAPRTRNRQPESEPVPVAEVVARP